jgi:hypothetical protein
LFPGDTSLIVTNPKHSESIKDINVMFTKINNCFKANLLSLSFEKKYSFVHFLTKNGSNIDIIIGYEDKQIPNTIDIKFLGIMIDDKLMLKTRKIITPKLSSASYAVRAMKLLYHRIFKKLCTTLIFIPL